MFSFSLPCQQVSVIDRRCYPIVEMSSRYRVTSQNNALNFNLSVTTVLHGC